MFEAIDQLLCDGLPSGVHGSDAARLQHGQAALRRAAGLYPFPCMFQFVLKKKTKTAEIGMILMLVSAHVHADAYALCMVLPYESLMSDCWRPVTQAWGSKGLP